MTICLTARRGPCARVSIVALLPIGLAALAGPEGLARADVTYSDGTFATSTWGFETIGTGTSTPSQIATGGNPGSYRQINQTVTPNSGWFYSFSRYGTNTATRYDPILLGAIQSIDFSIQAQTISVQSGQIPGLAVGIKQGSLVFVQTAFQNLSGPAWATFTSSALTPADFFCANGSGTLDFSATAAPLRFGFVTMNASFSAATTGSLTEYDNFSVVVHQVPAPAGLATLGLLGLIANRRRR